MSREDEIAAAVAEAIAWGPSFVVDGVRSGRGRFASLADCQTGAVQVLAGRLDLGSLQVSYYGDRPVGGQTVTGFHTLDVGRAGPLPEPGR